MRLKILIGAGLLAALTAGHAGSQTPATTSVELTKPASKAAGPELICKKSDVTGSRVRKKRVCLTRREWDRQTKGGERSAEDLARHRESYTAPAPPGG